MCRLGVGVAFASDVASAGGLKASPTVWGPGAAAGVTPLALVRGTPITDPRLLPGAKPPGNAANYSRLGTTQDRGPVCP
jgi:hypothetical protein